VSDTAIEWTDTTSTRIRATAAARIGLSLATYDARRTAGEKWCGGCREWHSRAAFGMDRTRTDGLAARCRDAKNSRARELHEWAPPRETGRRYVEARGGDQLQARRRINYLIDIGRLPRPDTLPCSDCAHTWSVGERRHEYDHHLGYAPEHHEDVEAVCTTCHHLREQARRSV
jgi:hypothetical protein